MTDKQSLRERMTLWRDALPATERVARSQAATQRLLAHPAYRRARTLLIFVAFRSEIETQPLIQAALTAGKVVAVPKVERQPKGLLPCRLHAFPGPLRAGAYGILEPGDDQTEPVPPGDLDLVVVPGLAFDRQGRRLGYGGGYYDRLLAGPAAAALAVGFCFEEQVLSSVPADPHDRPMNLIITDQATHTARP